MLDINEIHNSNLEVVELDGHELALKSFVLFTNIDNKNVIAITKEYINVSFDYLSKYPQ
ncbi:MAG: type II/IV secretion system protein, partial [Campylobacteraceae bacterium]|nr:type II/IV secretion system protein [bacterium]MBT6388568.1 type II/IV secretion system protein [Campylobacteraceae bacterium]MBT6578567.1 type II/IV secretion system protein [Campylobacteraceae bacterium]